MKAPKLLLDHISAVSRLGGTKASRSAARGISVALAAAVISLYSMFLLQALTPEPELWRWIEFYEGRKYEIAPLPVKPESLSVGKNLGVGGMRRVDVTKTPPSGKKAFERLPKGEPGGRVTGRGRDIQGVFRLVRIQHELADWWADQSSLVALTQWLNAQTGIKTDM
jgi:hypothetical protein